MRYRQLATLTNCIDVSQIPVRAFQLLVATPKIIFVNYWYICWFDEQVIQLSMALNIH